MDEPVTLSMAWKIDAEVLDNAGVIDVTLNCDTHLFIDPLLMEEASDADVIPPLSLCDNHQRPVCFPCSVRCHRHHA